MNIYIFALKIIFNKFNIRLVYDKSLDKYYLEADTNEGFVTTEEVAKNEAIVIKTILDEI